MKRQSGISMVGFVIILIILAFFGYTLMKLVPAYMDYFSVSKALTTVATNAQSSSGGMDLSELHRQLQLQEISQYFDDSDVSQDNLHVVTNPNGGSMLQLSYDKKIPWIYNIDLLLHFQKSVPVRRAEP